MARSSSNRNSARARASSVFPTPVGPRNRNEPIGRLRVGQTGAAAAHGVRNSRKSVILANDALPQALFHVHELLHFAFQQPPDGNARPFGDDASDVFLAHFFLEHCAAAFLPLR